MAHRTFGRRDVVLGIAAGGLFGTARAQNDGVERLVESVRQAMSETDRQAAVEQVLRREVSDPVRLLGKLGEPISAGIHPLHRSPELTILNVVWAPMMVLLPHNHNMWASIGIYTGREDNILWEGRGASISATRAASLSERDVFGLSADAIHSVTNPIGRLSGAIHVYGGDFFAPGRSEWDAETLKPRAWDLEAARSEFGKAADRFAAVP